MKSACILFLELLILLVSLLNLCWFYYHFETRTIMNCLDIHNLKLCIYKDFQVVYDRVQFHK